MIEVGKDKHHLLITDRIKIKERLVKHTCKTNLSPHLLFTNQYNDNTSRTFIGNVTDDGFWITRYRKQFMNYRADVVAKGTFKEYGSKLELSFNYSLGFSSIVGGAFIIIIIAAIMISNGLNFFLSFAIPIIIYGLLTRLEVSKAKEAINNYLLNEYQE